MSEKVSITLDSEVLSFIDKCSSNRSSYINGILWREKQRIFREELAAAYAEQSNDPEFQSEINTWDTVASDALDA